jgi:hypothetical protein
MKTERRKMLQKRVMTIEKNCIDSFIWVAIFFLHISLHYIHFFITCNVRKRYAYFTTITCKKTEQRKLQ